MFNNCFNEKKVLITGNTGFKGSWLSVWMLHLGAQVTGISKDIPTSPSLFEELKLSLKLDHRFADVCDIESVKKIFDEVKPDFVFHLAAQPIVSISYQEPMETFRTNVIGTGNVLEAIRGLSHPCQAVIITSDKCYDNVEWIWGYRENDTLGGKDPYSASKGAAELIIKSYYYSYFDKTDSNIRLVSARAGNVIGGGDWAINRIIPDCVRAWSENREVKIRNPISTRPWQHVLEPLSGYMRLAQILHEDKTKISGQAFNLGPHASQNYTVLEVLKELSTHWKFGDLANHFLIESNSAFHEAGLLKLNCDKAHSLLGWTSAMGFSDTLRFTGEWYNNFYNNKTISIFDFSVSQIKEYQKLAYENKLSWAQ
jgi:CDP-glucose 4,6-dehydratase